MKNGRICGILFLLWLTSGAFPADGQTAGTDMPDCSTKPTSSERLHCIEEFSRRTKAVNRTSELPGGWRLVKTANPRGGPDAVSIMHISDSAKSDLALAGLTLRCAQSGGIEALLILLDPIDRKSSLLATPIAVKIKSGSAATDFEASIVQGGEAVLLRKPPLDEVLKGWEQASDLDIDIASETPIRGHVAVTGLSDATAALAQACAAR